MNEEDLFRQTGFLSFKEGGVVADVRAENAEWFDLASDVNVELMKLAVTAMESAKTSTWSPESVTARVVLRSCSLFQGIILMAERGMIIEARTLSRSLLESAFCIAALHDSPSIFMQMLRDDDKASLRKRGDFILAEKLGDSGNDLAKLRKVISKMEKTETISPKKLAKLGPLIKQYLAYLQLSGDSAHISARALHRHIHINADGKGWSYLWGAGDKKDVASTLDYAVMAALPVGVGTSQMLKRDDHNKAFGGIVSRFVSLRGQLPKVAS